MKDFCLITKISIFIRCTRQKNRKTNYLHGCNLGLSDKRQTIVPLIVLHFEFELILVFGNSQPEPGREVCSLCAEFVTIVN